MSKASAQIKPKVKKKPVKAGSSPRPHGGAPTAKVIKIITKMKSE